MLIPTLVERIRNGTQLLWQIEAGLIKATLTFISLVLLFTAQDQYSC
jgi:hypothetical protein